LGLPVEPAGIEDEQRVFGVHFFGRTIGGLRRAAHLPINIAAFNHRNIRAGVAQHDDRFDRGNFGQRLIDIGLQRHGLAAAQAFVGGQYHGAIAILNPAGERLRAEAGEHDRMDRADPRAGEHGDGGLGHHRQVDGDAIPLLHAARFHEVGEAADAFVQFAVSDRARRAGRIIGFPQDRRRIAALRQMPVERIGRQVQGAVGEPADAEIGFVEAGVLDRGEGPDPVDPLRCLTPEAVGIGHRAAIHLIIARAIDQGAVCPLGRDGIDRIAHGRLSSS
jgi:hypothetical protein